MLISVWATPIHRDLMRPLHKTLTVSGHEALSHAEIVTESAFLTILE